MILINLLPHREETRKRKKIAFFVGLGVAAAAGLAIVGGWYLIVDQMKAAQQERNQFLTAEIAKLVVHDVGSKALGSQTIEASCVAVLIAPAGASAKAAATTTAGSPKTPRRPSS